MNECVKSELKESVSQHNAGRSSLNTGQNDLRGGMAQPSAPHCATQVQNADIVEVKLRDSRWP
jgi:hypothetical protein